VFDTSPISPLIGVLLVCFVCFWVVILVIRAYRLKIIFSKSNYSQELIAEVNSLLERINQGSQVFIFSAERAKKIGKNQDVCFLVYGKTGFVAPGDCGPEWCQSKSTFLIVPAAKSMPFLAKPRIFKQAFEGSGFSIFWMNIYTMTNKTMELTVHSAAVSREAKYD